MIYNSRFRIGERVRVIGYAGFGTVAGIRFTKDRIFYDVDRDIGGKTVRDVSCAIVEPA